MSENTILNAFNNENNPKRLHNKSKLSALTICGMSDEAFGFHLDKMRANSRRAPAEQCLIPGSPCFVQGDKEGRYSFKGQKITFGHHLAARERFGAAALEGVESNKAQDSITISHLCGTRRCCVASHLILETKEVNDQRTHCHFVLLNVLRQSGPQGVQNVLNLGACPHEPKCGTLG